MNRLDGKIAFLSGAARGIGGATAKLMASAGAKVAIGDVLDERGRQTVKEIEAAGGQALFVPLDVTSEASWAAAMDATVKKFGKLDVLVNNAGIFVGKGVEEASLDDWHRLVAVNLTGVVLGTRAALPHLKASGSRARTVGDRQSRLDRGSGGLAARSALFADQGRRDAVHQVDGAGVRPQGLQIRVNSIHPGLIETDMGEQTFVMRAQRRSAPTTPRRRARPRSPCIRSAGWASPTTSPRASCSWRRTMRAS